ncbi:hypothetical protein [Paenibacillus sp. MSJ-34]|uniref:hypothetical protein n=1 Tax=Paenibacillus sp. MSJ-34 TaxID=2841529 RepID=UPI001C0F3FA6|nr:hypothetical protein [Paenibacillus sp. MSJ-34]MBU5445080.1 hypothetical protein [Paenibacillus sp. MSJ-34]
MKPRRWQIWLLLLVVIGLVGFDKPDHGKRATYLWQADLIVSERQSVLSFLQEQSVQVLYLNIDPKVSAQDYKTFAAEASKSGVEVYALGGEPEWALSKYKGRISAFVDWVREYNESAQPAERFAGIHVNVQPYLLPEWETSRDDLLRQWTGNADYTATEAKAALLKTSADLPAWYDGMKLPDAKDETVVSWMLKQFDTVTIMAYRNTAEGDNGIVSLVTDELAEADRLEKPVLIAVNINKSDEGKHVSFYNKGAKSMERELERLPGLLGQHASFAGIAVHDYASWSGRVRLESASKPIAGPIKATYVWEADTAVRERKEIIDFAKSNDVNLLYVRLDLERPFADYRPLVADASAAGIEVHAMGGHPQWALAKSKERIMKLVRYVRQYNEEAGDGEKMRGIHLDIEPYVMPLWQSNRDSILKQWMDNIQAFAEAAKQSGDLQTSVDLAFWLDGTSVPGEPDLPFSKWMIGQLDHVTVMAFRNYAEGPGGIADIVRDELGFADELGKQIIVSVEMKESHEGESVSFFHKGKAEMNRQLEIAEGLLKQHASFRGFAVHAYDYWKEGKE